jgi:hypothetical protein
MKKCPTCGTVFLDSFEACPADGASLESKTEPTNGSLVEAEALSEPSEPLAIETPDSKPDQTASETLNIEIDPLATTPLVAQDVSRRRAPLPAIPPQPQTNDGGFNIKKIVIISTAILVVGFVGGYFATRNTEQQPTEETVAPSSVDTGGQPVKPGNLVTGRAEEGITAQPLGNANVANSNSMVPKVSNINSNVPGIITNLNANARSTAVKNANAFEAPIVIENKNGGRAVEKPSPEASSSRNSNTVPTPASSPSVRERQVGPKPQTAPTP